MKITAHVPTQQYGFIEIEGEPTEREQIQTLYNFYAETPINFRTAKLDRPLLKAFVGGEVYYDDLSHTYSNEAGEIYLSGSKYAEQFRKPFDKRGIANKMAEKYGVDAQDIIAMWELKGDVSKGFGTAMHASLELYGKYRGLATALERDTAMHDHPVIKTAVTAFYEGREKEKAEYEALIVDHNAKHAGQIDRLLITGNKRCRVQDYKTNADITKDLDVYWKQLQFYADILTAGGWVVEGLDIFHWDGEWHTFSQELV